MSVCMGMRANTHTHPRATSLVNEFSVISNAVWWLFQDELFQKLYPCLTSDLFWGQEGTGIIFLFSDRSLFHQSLHLRSLSTRETSALPFLFTFACQPPFSILHITSWSSEEGCPPLLVFSPLAVIVCVSVHFQGCFCCSQHRAQGLVFWSNLEGLRGEEGNKGRKGS